MSRSLRYCAFSLTISVAALMGCDGKDGSNSSVDYAGFSKVQGKFLKFELMLPQGSKPCGPDYSYDCFKVDTIAGSTLVTVSEVGGDGTPLKSEQDAKKWANGRHPGMEARGAKALANGDFSVELGSTTGIGVVAMDYFSKSKTGHLVANCTGSPGDEKSESVAAYAAELAKACSSLKSLQ